jgi:alpha-ribazole phosphatase
LSRLLLVRHGEIEQKNSNSYWGHSDIDLSDTGLRQAELLRDRLNTEKIDFLYSSDLKRAYKTAQIITEKHDIPTITCTELREIDFGNIEGLTFNDINRLYPEVARMWIEQDHELAYPGGESLAEFDERVQLFKKRLDGYTEKQTILIVSHSGVLSTLICQFLLLQPWQRWQFRFDLASLTIVETYPEGAILSLLNDISHLKERSL